MSRKIIARLRIDDDTALDSIGCLSEKIGSLGDISLVDAVASDKDGVIYAYLDYVADWAFKQAGRDEGDDFEVPMSFDDWADSAECPAEKKKFNPFYDSMFLISRDSNRVPKRFFVELYPDELIELWDALENYPNGGEDFLVSYDSDSPKTDMPPRHLSQLTSDEFARLKFELSQIGYIKEYLRNEKTAKSS